MNPIMRNIFQRLSLRAPPLERTVQLLQGGS